MLHHLWLELLLLHESWEEEALVEASSCKITHPG